jgi:hypothetical protein
MNYNKQWSKCGRKPTIKKVRDFSRQKELEMESKEKANVDIAPSLGDIARVHPNLWRQLALW